MYKEKGNYVNAYLELKNNNGNAVSHVYSNKNKKREGILSNVVTTIKDVYATKEGSTQASSKLLENFVAGYNATIIDKLENEGAEIVGKVHLDELALGGTGGFSAFGKINHPQDETRMPGGSSSGSIATFTKNVGLAIGSDTGDSVRTPASYNGVVGFKPSYGAISRYGQFAFASSLDTVAYFTHNVHDAIITAKVLYGVDNNDMTSIEIDKPELISVKPSKIAILDMKGVISETAQKELDVLTKKLVNAKIIIDKVSPDIKILNQIETVYEVISFSEMSSNDANLTGFVFGNRQQGKNYEKIATNTRSKLLGGMVQRRMALGAFFLEKENQITILNQAKKIRRMMKDMMDKIYDKYDILIFPSQRIAPKWSENKIGDWYTNILTLSNLVGNPSITIPWIKENNLPIGLSIEGKRYHDKDLLSNSLWLENFLGGEYEE